MKKVVLFLAGGAAGAAGRDTYQDRGAECDERFGKARAHVCDVTQNVMNMKKPHMVQPSRKCRRRISAVGQIDIHGERLPSYMSMLSSIWIPLQGQIVAFCAEM